MNIKENNLGKYKFQTEASVSTTRFPKDIAEGIELEGNDSLITLLRKDGDNWYVSK